MADHTESVRDAGTEAGLTDTEIDEIIARVGRREWGGTYMIGNRRQECAAYDAIDRMAERKRTAEARERLGGEPATPRQRSYLASLGATPEQIDACTKAAASQLIDDLKARRSGRSAAARARAAGAELGIDGEIWDE